MDLVAIAGPDLTIARLDLNIMEQTNHLSGLSKIQALGHFIDGHFIDVQLIDRTFHRPDTS